MSSPGLPADRRHERRPAAIHRHASGSARETEAFNQWIQTEASRQLRNTPAFRQQAAAGAR